MKKITLLALLMACCVFTSVAQANDICIKGKIEGFKKGRLYLLTRSSETATDTLGYCDFKRGKFALKTAIAEPLVTQLVVDGFAGGFMLFAEPGVEYQAYLSEGEDFYIRGGRLNDSYTAHMRVSDSLRVAVEGLQGRYDALRAERKFRGASLVNDTLRRVQESLRTLTTDFLAGNDNLIKAYTYYSNIEMRDANLRETRSMYAELGDGARATQYGRMIEERIVRLAKTEGGAKAPDFVLADTQGNMVTMSEVKGKVKIIDFWASWCYPCRKENPFMVKLYEKYHEKGLEIIGVSLDNDHKKWTAAIEKDGLPWIQISALKKWQCKSVKLYDVKSVPHTVILDGENRIIARNVRGEELEKLIAQILDAQ